MHGANDDGKFGKESALSFFKVNSFTTTRHFYFYEIFTNQPSEMSKGTTYNSALVKIFVTFSTYQNILLFQGGYLANKEYSVEARSGD